MPYKPYRPKRTKLAGQAVMLTAAIALGIGGCAAQRPARLIDDVNSVPLAHKTRDARAQRINGRPCLRVDAATRQHLEIAMASNDLAQARGEALAFLDEAHRLAIGSTLNELDRLDQAGWDDLTTRQFGTPAGGDEKIRDRIKQLFVVNSEARYWFLRRQIESAESVEQVRHVLVPLNKQIETPVSLQGRLSRIVPWSFFTLPSALVVAQVHRHEYRGDMDTAFESAIRYSPDLTRSGDADGADAHDWQLLTAYAPVIVQETPADVAYQRTVDSFGRVVAPDDKSVAIDTTDPAVYAYARHIRLRGRPCTQLIYTYWYPEHPALKPNDPEAGKIEGLTMRITLDEHLTPITFETLYNCGCHHRLYPTEDLERAAVRDYGDPEKGKQFTVERRVPGKIDAIVPKLVDFEAAGRPVIRARAGWHGIANVAKDESGHGAEVRGEKLYTLRPYHELESLTTPDGRTVSMFYDNGLVKGAQRLEGVFFTPLGLLSAGQPRQRGTQLIHWDHHNFDDPALLETLLRLPTSPEQPSTASWTGHQ